MKLKALAASTALLLAAGCTDQEDYNEGLTDLDTRIMNNESGFDTETSSETEEIEQPAGTTTAGSTSSTLKASKGPVPALIRGRWGMNMADCTSVHGNAQGLLEISGTTLTFYEAQATLSKVKETEPSRLRALFNYEAEGMEWQSDVLLEVQEEGQTLLRREYGPDTPPQPTRYKRCAD